MKLNVYAYELNLKHPFTISRGTITTQPTMVVSLEHNGVTGFGESTTNSYYGHDLEEMAKSLENIQAELEQTDWDSAEQIWDAFDGRLQSNRFAQCALDQAAHDLFGKLNHQRVIEHWGHSIHDPMPASNYTIGIDSIDKMKSKLDEYPDWPIYKIKLGSPQDLEIIRALRDHTSAVFRVDANCGWDAEKTIEMSETLKGLGVEYIEQPLPADDIDGMAQLAGNASLPIIADESCIEEKDVADCFHIGFNGINIKLCKCGGLTPARRMIEEARTLGLRVMVGCMTESSVGISAIAQLLPLIDYVDMDGATLLSSDIAEGVQLVRGTCQFGDRMGTGVEMTQTGQLMI